MHVRASQVHVSDCELESTGIESKGCLNARLKSTSVERIAVCMHARLDSTSIERIVVSMPCQAEKHQC